LLLALVPNNMSTGSHSCKDVVYENQERKTMCMWLGTISDVINSVKMYRD